MKIKSRVFGEIDISEDKVLYMPVGLPGFSNRNRFVLLERKETRPFCWFQSVDDPDLALVLMNPYLFKTDYTINYGSVLKEMGWEEDKEESLAVYVVVTINDQGPYRVTANLIGPIVINTKKCEAVQLVIYDSPYSHQHPVVEQQEVQEKRAIG